MPRPRLIERLNAGLHRKLTLISAPAGFGKTTLLSEWIHHLETRFLPKNLVSGLPRPAAWLSLDEGDNAPVRFISYLIAALQTLHTGIAQNVLALLRTPQPLPAPSVVSQRSEAEWIKSVMTTLVNEIVTVSDDLFLVLDDYHVIEHR